ncbi:MAG: biotin transporter BioY [Methanomicrobiales archaeon]|jgi:biotin transport system substrate-specific component|nr:biotin transporter BioY [Methanomicrobiales archaeon]
MYGDRVLAGQVTHTALFISLIAAGAWVSVPAPPVPFTLQTLFVLLAGAVMGRAAVVPVALYLLLGALNLPVFHNGAAGVGVFLGPTGGYLLGFLPAAALVGIAYEGDSPLRHAAGLTTATFAILLSGVAWLLVSTGMPLSVALLVGLVPFLPGDLIKAAAVAVIAKRLKSRVGSVR